MGTDTYIDEEGNLVTYEVETGNIVDIQPNGGIPPSPAAGTVADTGTPLGTNPDTSALNPTNNGQNSGTAPTPGRDPVKPLNINDPVLKVNGGFYWKYGDNTMSGFIADSVDPVKAASDLANLDILLQRVAAGQSSGGGVSATTAYSQQQQNNRDAASLAESQRQYNETFGFEKAKYNQDFAESQRQFNETQATHKGDTLLGLGSRPDTLVKYLYAIRGQQTPQAIQGTTQALPGYGNAMGGGVTTPGAAAGAAPAAKVAVGAQTTAQPNAAAPQIAQAQQQATDRTAQAATMAPNSGTTLTTPLPNIGPGGSAPTLTQPTQQLAVNPLGQANLQLPTSTGAVGSIPAGATVANVQTNAAGASAPISLSDWAVKNGFNLAKYAKGGVIPERVVGIGMNSGELYEFGEKGKEVVVPQNKVPDTIFDKLSGMDGNVEYSENDGKSNKKVKVNRYASGGTIGYNPTQTPSLGSEGAGFFNDPNLQSVVQRGYNSNPNVPLFPQVNVATNNGQSLVPSQQRINSLLPSEQSLYAGTLQDEFGAQPDDVFALARKLAPQVSGLRTPRFAS